VDAKYRLDIGSRDQVYQMCSYLGYEYPDSEAVKSKIGLLVYPGIDWKVGKLDGFDKEVYCIQLPITNELKQPEIENFLSSVLS
jgi:hypothetical protein